MFSSIAMSLSRALREFAGTFVGLAFFLGGIGTWVGHVGLPELNWLLIGTGLGTALTDLLASIDRRRAETRHREQLTLMLGTLSGTQRQALRFGTALAEMMTDASWPSPSEKRLLLANSGVLGVEDQFKIILEDPEARRIEAVQIFLLTIRGTRGRHAADGFALGYRLERMAREVEAREVEVLKGEDDATFLAAKADIITELRVIIKRSFPLDTTFQLWLDRNLEITRVLPANRVAILRYALRMLWQSRHLETRPDTCECVQPCAKRHLFFHEVAQYKDGRETLLPASFKEKLSQFEISRRERDFVELSRF
jgi:hypothetical protein